MLPNEQPELVSTPEEIPSAEEQSTERDSKGFNSAGQISVKNGVHGRRSLIDSILRDIATLAVLLCVVLIPFAGALEPGHTLSRLSLLNEIDYLQNPNRSEPFYITLDPSASLIHVPNEVFAQGCLSELPLWNPFNGAGRPFVGDFQTLLFSFFHQIFPAGRDSFLYVLGFFAKLAIGSIGAYLLSRYLNISRLASFAVGQSFSLCAHSLRFLELCDNFCFYPWAVLVAVWATSKKCVHRSVLLALVIAALAYNMHPETFVCAAGTALAAGAICKFGQNRQLPLSQNLVDTGVWFCLVSILSFGLAAPVVLPFCEFIANGMSYKFSNSEVGFVSLISFLSELAAPFVAGNNYIGSVLALLLPLGIVAAWRKCKFVAIVFVLLLLFTTRPALLEPLLAMRPFSYFLPIYSYYMLILFSSICGALGLDFLITSVAEKKALRPIALRICFVLALLVFIVQTPIVCSFICDKTEFVYERTAIEGIMFWRAFVLLVTSYILLEILFFSSKSSRQFPQTLLICASLALLFLNALPLNLNANKELPVAESFWYKQDSGVTELKTRFARQNSDSMKNFRCMATSYDLFVPNSNLIFQLDDIRSTSPLHPKRYAAFAELMGMRDAFCNIAESPSNLNHLYDLASVKYILSKQPVCVGAVLAPPALDSTGLKHAIPFPFPAAAERGFSTADAEQQVWDCKEPVKILPQLRLESARLIYSPELKEINGYANVLIHHMGARIYNYQIVLQNESGKVLWSSYPRRECIEDLSLETAKRNYQIPISIPVNTSSATKVKVVLVLKQGFWSSESKPMTLAMFTIRGKNTELQDNRKRGGASTAPTRGLEHEALKQSEATQLRFKRQIEYPGGFALYENTEALPSAYLVHSVNSVENPAASLKAVGDGKKNWKDFAVLEKSIDGETPANLDSKGVDSAADLVRLLDKSANSVSIYSVSKDAAYLVLTDTFYPGWKAYVDGKPSTIFPANHAFRSVFVPAGKHSILFEYEPATFDVGCKLMLLSFISCLLAIAIEISRNTKSEKKRTLIFAAENK